MHSRDLLIAAAGHAADFLETLPDGRVEAEVLDADELRARLAVPLPDAPTDPRTVLDELVGAATPGLVRSQSPRYFGYVIGGTLPAALAADVVVAGWDQNAGGYSVSPAASVVEEVAGGWLLELLGLPAGASFGLTTGCQQAHVTCLAAARNAVLAGVGWDAESGGLQGAPRVRLVVSAERHVTIDRAVRILGFGTDALVPVAVDADGPHGPGRAARRARRRRGADDRVRAGRRRQHRRLRSAGRDRRGRPRRGRMGPHRRRLRPVGGGQPRSPPPARRATPAPTRGPPTATSGSTCPTTAAWPSSPTPSRTATRWSSAPPTCAARARASATARAGCPTSRAAAAASRSTRRCARSGARASPRWSSAAARARGASPRSSAPSEAIEILNDVALNQVLVRFADDDATTDAVVAAVQAEGTCWMSPTTWRGRRAMRISVCNWATTISDVDRSCEAILAAARARPAPPRSR